jgi:glycosyltransferase involved in cell wall biosynthesis
LNGVKGKIIWLTEYITCKFAKKVIVIAPSLRDHAVHKNVVSYQKTHVIGLGSSNGIQIDKFNPILFSEEEIIDYKKSVGIPHNAFVFGYVGRIVRDKGILEMYEAFKKIKNDNTYLVLAGEFENDDAIPEVLKNELLMDIQVKWVGFISNVPKIIQCFNVLILFSYREGFGNVVLEASCMTKPALVSDIPGLKDTVVENSTGFKIESKNVLELSSKMNFYFNNPTTAIEHGINGRQRVIENFDSNLIHEQLFKIYQEVIQTKSNQKNTNFGVKF